MIEKILDRLTLVRRAGEGRWMARCPAHEDRTPSLSVKLLQDGRILLHCFGCGTGAVEIIMSLGLQPSELFPAAMREYRPDPSISIGRAVDDLSVALGLVLAANKWILAGKPLLPSTRAELIESGRKVNAAMDGIHHAL